MPLVAGVDCSTQSTKVLVVDLDDGRVVASGAASHEVEGDRGARETDPVAWEVSVSTALNKTGLAAQVAAISIAAQQHGMVVLDGDARPVRKAPLWNDTRDAADARALVAALGGPEAAARRVGSVLTTSFTVAHWAWLRRTEPEVAAAVRQVMLPHDYLSLRLTGQATTDRSDVSGTGWWSPADETYAADVLALDLVRIGCCVPAHGAWARWPGRPGHPRRGREVRLGPRDAGSVRRGRQRGWCSRARHRPR